MCCSTELSLGAAQRLTDARFAGVRRRTGSVLTTDPTRNTVVLTTNLITPH